MFKHARGQHTSARVVTIDWRAFLVHYRLTLVVTIITIITIIHITIYAINTLMLNLYSIPSPQLPVQEVSRQLANRLKGAKWLFLFSFLINCHIVVTTSIAINGTHMGQIPQDGDNGQNVA